MRFDSLHSRPGTSIDVAAVYAVADRFGAAARLVDDAACGHLARLTFGGAGAGRAHTARGEALRAALDRLAGELSRWSSAADEIAVALHTGADRYVDTERYAAARIA